MQSIEKEGLADREDRSWLGKILNLNDLKVKYCEIRS
jgi:hypothetical protein